MKLLVLVVAGIFVWPEIVAAAPSVDKTKINEYLRHIDLESQLRDLKFMMLQYHGKCDVNDGDQCFFAIIAGGGMNQEAARLACEKNGAQPANICTEDQYLKVMEYLRPWIATRTNEQTGIGIRTGMTFEPKSQIMYLYDGSKAPFESWKKDSPKTGGGRTSIILDVYGTGSVYNGMGNNYPTNANYGVLCEISV